MCAQQSWTLISSNGVTIILVKIAEVTSRRCRCGNLICQPQAVQALGTSWSVVGKNSLWEDRVCIIQEVLKGAYGTQRKSSRDCLRRFISTSLSRSLQDSTDNLTSLLVCLIADAPSACASVCNKFNLRSAGATMRDLRNLVLSDGDSSCVCLLNRRNVAFLPCLQPEPVLQRCYQCWSDGPKVSDLLKHCIDLRRELLKKCQLPLIVAVSAGRECLLLDVCWWTL